MISENYADWFKKSINCNICTQYIYGKNDEVKKGFICNYNISKYKENEIDSPVRPQAGCIDIDWFDKEKRILLLGLNPRDGYKEHEALYEIYDQIIASKVLTKELMKSIQAIVDNYWVLKMLKSEIQKNIFPGTAFAYSNQILCRTKPEASEIKETDGIKEVYEKCFKERISELIKIIKPTKIIAVGKRWRIYFENEMSKYFSQDKFICACHPAYGRGKETLEQIKKYCLENQSSSK